MINKKTLLLGLTIFSSSLILKTASLTAAEFPQSPSLSFSSPSEQTIAQTASSYKVKLGDTLSGIAYKFGLSIAQLLKYNPSLGNNPQLLMVGQVINLRPNSQPPAKPKVSSSPKNQTFARLNIPDERRPGSSRIGSKRGTGTTCLKNPDDQLKILLPDTNFGYTLQDYPTFFWYSPTLSSDSISLEFRLRQVEKTDETGKLLYKTKLNNISPGIQSLSLPTGAPPLEEGKEYEWDVRINCDDYTDIITSGRIQRMSTDNSTLESKLEKAPIEDYPAILAEAGVWYDSLAMVAALHQNDLKNEFWTKQWAELLKKIGFESLKDVPERQITPEAKTNN